MWINKETAKELGMTHEGVQFGVKVWLRVNNELEFQSIPKFIPCALWLFLCDFLYELATYVMPPDRELETPLEIGDRI